MRDYEVWFWGNGGCLLRDCRGSLGGVFCLGIEMVEVVVMNWDYDVDHDQLIMVLVDDIVIACLHMFYYKRVRCYEFSV